MSFIRSLFHLNTRFGGTYPWQLFYEKCNLFFFVEEVNTNIFTCSFASFLLRLKLLYYSNLAKMLTK